MKINGSPIRVRITETYEGSCHYHVRIYLPGFGVDHPGFVLCNVEELQRNLGEFWGDFLGDTTLRPEYAKTIKQAMEGWNDILFDGW